MFYKNARIRIVYEDHSSDFLLVYDVVSIKDIPSDLEKYQVFELLTEYFECDKNLIEKAKKFNNVFIGDIVSGDPIVCFYLKASAGSVFNVKPEQVMECFYQFMGLEFQKIFYHYHP